MHVFIESPAASLRKPAREAQAMSENRTGSVEREETVYGMAACGDAVDIAEIVRTRAGSTIHKSPRASRP